VNLIVAVGFLSLFLLIPPLYFLRLMADARRLKGRVVERPVDPGPETREGQVLLLPTDGEAWRAVPFSAEEASDAAREAAPDSFSPFGTCRPT